MKPDNTLCSIFEKLDMARRRGQFEGHVYRQSGNWMLRYRVDSRELDPVTGRPRRERITVTLARIEDPNDPKKKKVTKFEAKRIAWEEYLSKVDVMGLRPSSMRTLREFIETRFKPDVVENLKPSGKAFYKKMFNAHILPALGSKRLRDLTRSEVQNLMNAKLQAGKSTQTVLHIKNCLSATLKHARALEWTAGELPTAGIRLPEMKRKARHALTWGQVCDLSKRLQEPVATLVPLLALTGLRIGEALGLRWKRLNLTDDYRTVDGETIPPMSIAVRESYVLGDYQSLKGLKSSRNVPLQEWFVPALLKLQKETKWAAPDDPVFPGPRRGKPLNRNNASADFLKPAARAMKIPWASWHCLRHTNSTLADVIGITAAERQRILGHSTQAMALHYTHAELERLRPRWELIADPKMLQ